MRKPPMPPDDLLTLLETHPERIATLTAGLSAAQLRTPPEPEAWSVTDVLAHLRACADMWGACIATMLREDAPTLRAVNPRYWVRQTDYLDLAFAPSFAAYLTQRDELLNVLCPLPPEAWQRSATVTGAGAPLTRTVHFYAEWLATHERTHVKQIGRIVQGVKAG